MSNRNDVERRAQMIEDLDRIDRVAESILSHRTDMIGMTVDERQQVIRTAYDAAIEIHYYSANFRHGCLINGGYSPERPGL